MEPQDSDVAGSIPASCTFFLLYRHPGRRPEHGDGFPIEGLVLSINKAHVRRKERILILGSGSESPEGASVIKMTMTMIRTEGVSGKPKRLDTWETDQLLALWLP